VTKINLKNFREWMRIGAEFDRRNRKALKRLATLQRARKRFQKEQIDGKED